MPNEANMPPGVTVKETETAPVNQGQSTDEGLLVMAPDLRGMLCAIAFGTGTGSAPEVSQTGLLGFGIIINGAGTSFLLEMKHKDGRCMAAFLDPDDMKSFADLFNRTVGEARLIRATDGQVAS